MPPPTAPGAHDAGIDYGVLAPDIATDNIAAHIAAETDGADEKKSRRLARDARRQIMPLKEYEDKMNEKNAQLREKDLDPLIEEELIAARLYTGPMYSKYNDVLRVIGTLRGGESDEQQRHLSEELSKKLKEQQDKDEKKARAKEDRAMNLDDVSITGNTFGNLYTTTLHVINSAVLKLGKLAKVQTVYRGIAHRTLPKKMLNKGMDNARGGIEYGFSSASTIREEAWRYATKDKATTPMMLEMTPMLLEIEQGLIDRGADLEWLSQYPHEAEVLFPPLTGLEFLKFRVEDGLLIVTVRPSVNLHSLTIEKVIAKMKTSHLQLLDLLTEGLRFAGVPGPALQPLTNLKVTAEGRDPEYYNSTLNYRDVTKKAIDTQTAVFESLLKPSHESGDVRAMDANNILATAELAARAGQHQTAIQLLLRRQVLLRCQQQLPNEDTPALLKRIAEEILDGGCVKPWPATLVELASERTEELSLKDFKELLSSSKQETPFSKGAPVRVFLRDTWMNARIHGKKEKPDRESFGDDTAADKWSRECHAFIDQRRKKAEEAKLEAKAKAEQLVAAEQVAPPNELLKARKASEAATKAADEASQAAKPAKAADDYYFDGKPPKYSGVMYEVVGHLEDGEVEENVKDMHEEDVIALCHSGLPLVLCVAAQEGEPRVVDALLEAKVSPYATDKNGSTALIRICSRRENIRKEHYECIELLLNATCKQFFHVRNLQRQNAYDLATRNKQCETLRLMSPSSFPCMLLGTNKDCKKDKEDRDKDERKFKKRDYWAHDETWASGMSTLMVTLRFAPKETVENCVRKLLAARADESDDERLKRLKPLVNFKHPKGGSMALHMALVTEDLPEVVELLLKAGADVNAKEEAEGKLRTPLLQAAQAGHVKAAKVLIKYNADPFFTRDTRSTLMYADCH